MAAAGVSATASADAAVATLDDLYAYYTATFDWDRFFNFATCHNRYKISQRTFWFIFLDNNKSQRLMFSNKELVYGYVMRELPLVIHLGCVWPLQMEHGSAEAKRFVQRELILDIDLNDYGTLRATVCECGDARKCCDRCWTVFVQRTTVPFLKHMLCTVWGFREVFFVFSGRRGLHIYVQDERVMRMTQQQRSEIVVRGTLETLQDEVLYKKIFLPVYKEYFLDHRPRPVVQGVHPVVQGAPLVEEEEEESLRERVWETLKPRFDHGLLNDVSHVVKIPQSIHKDTGVICVYIECPEEFLPSKGCLFRVNRIFRKASASVDAKVTTRFGGATPSSAIESEIKKIRYL
jgi:DNA primase catalytic subunit